MGTPLKEFWDPGLLPAGVAGLHPMRCLAQAPEQQGQLTVGWGLESRKPVSLLCLQANFPRYSREQKAD